MCSVKAGGTAGTTHVCIAACVNVYIHRRGKRLDRFAAVITGHKIAIVHHKCADDHRCHVCAAMGQFGQAR